MSLTIYSKTVGCVFFFQKRGMLDRTLPNLNNAHAQVLFDIGLETRELVYRDYNLKLYFTYFILFHFPAFFLG